MPYGIPRVPRSGAPSRDSRVFDGFLCSGPVAAGGWFAAWALVEYLAGVGSGATALALIAATKACHQVGSLVVIDGSRNFYPPAAVKLGVDFANTILIQPRSHRDYLWALHQSLSCPGVGAVVSWPETLTAKRFDLCSWPPRKARPQDCSFARRGARGHPTWSEVQLLVETLAAHGPERRLPWKLFAVDMAMRAPRWNWNSVMKPATPRIAFSAFGFPIGRCSAYATQSGA